MRRTHCEIPADDAYPRPGSLPADVHLPLADERAERLTAVLHVLYLIFNEGYTSSGGPELLRADLSREAIRLTRGVHRLLPDNSEVAGLLALMLLTDARRAARTGPHGELIPLAEQDRTTWDREAIAEGVALVTATLPRGVRTRLIADELGWEAGIRTSMPWSRARRPIRCCGGAGTVGLISALPFTSEGPDISSHLGTELSARISAFPDLSRSVCL